MKNQSVTVLQGPEPWRGHVVARLLLLPSVVAIGRIAPMVFSDLALFRALCYGIISSRTQSFPHPR